MSKKKQKHSRFEEKEITIKARTISPNYYEDDFVYFHIKKSSVTTLISIARVNNKNKKWVLTILTAVLSALLGAFISLIVTTPYFYSPLGIITYIVLPLLLLFLGVICLILFLHFREKEESLCETVLKELEPMIGLEKKSSGKATKKKKINKPTIAKKESNNNSPLGKIQTKNK